MEQVLLVIHVMIAAALIGMVLLQRSDTDGFGLSGGSGSNLLSGRAAANAMTRITAILATLFIINSLVLSILASQNHSRSIIDAIEQQQAAPAGATKEDSAAPAVEKTTVKEEKASKTAEKPAAPAVPNADVTPAPAKKTAPKANPAAEQGDAGTAQD